MTGTTLPLGDRQQLDALVLAALAHGAGDGDDVWRRLQRQVGDSPGLSRGRMFSTLHRLLRNRLLDRGGGGRRYRLTDTGSRTLARRITAAEQYLEALRTLRGPGDG